MKSDIEGEDEPGTLFSIEPLFDFDDTKTLLLWILIKLLSVSEINLTFKVKVSLRMLKIQHPGLVIRIPEVWIRIPIPENISRGEEVKFGLMIRIPEVVIRISIPKVFSKVKKWNLV